MQSQVVCNGCRSVLLYPRGASNVCCALCNTITSVPLPDCVNAFNVINALFHWQSNEFWNGNVPTYMWRLQDIANVYTWGNKCEMLLLPHRESCTSVEFKYSLHLSLVLHKLYDSMLITKFWILVSLNYATNQVAHVNCGHCRTTLMYPYGAPSVKCAVCHYVTNVGMANARVPLPANRSNGTATSGTLPSSSMSQTQTVVVENPMTVDESGKLVSNVVVGITTEKK
ncbi:hypothetical protein Pint_11400 [Pistacia integerrima]|uniref:Uncharacterized protein n=1 Tax=Pistacia integerrima TaxID=434235 RepID=A0ACC0XIJ9_9ROSI|nr:hypothetical protein Pint_11400 [Pistacia integerrima]